MKKIRFIKESIFHPWVVGEVAEAEFVPTSMKWVMKSQDKTVWSVTKGDLDAALEHGYAEWAEEESRSKWGEFWEPNAKDGIFWIVNRALRASSTSDYHAYGFGNAFKSKDECEDWAAFTRAARKIDQYVKDANEGKEWEKMVMPGGARHGYGVETGEDGELYADVWKLFDPGVPMQRFLFKLCEDAEQALEDIPEEFKIFYGIK